jgi:hypothetical protein
MSTVIKSGNYRRLKNGLLIEQGAERSGGKNHEAADVFNEEKDRRFKLERLRDCAASQATDKCGCQLWVDAVEKGLALIDE